VIARWEPSGPAELTAGRRGLATALHDGARPPDADEGAVERLLLAYEDLASNALRHGRSPKPRSKRREPVSGVDCEAWERYSRS
jgi:hypothetical protein